MRRIRSLRRLCRIWIVFFLDEYVAAGRWLLLPVWHDWYKDAVKTEVILWIKIKGV